MRRSPESLTDSPRWEISPIDTEGLEYACYIRKQAFQSGVIIDKSLILVLLGGGIENPSSLRVIEKIDEKLVETARYPIEYGNSYRLRSMFSDSKVKETIIGAELSSRGIKKGKRSKYLIGKKGQGVYTLLKYWDAILPSADDYVVENK